jgi:hypothetical protein
VIATTPAACGGDTVWIWVADLTTYDLATVIPKLTRCTVVNPDPVIVTEFPPDVGPLVRDSEVIVGEPTAGADTVNGVVPLEVA